MAWERAAETSVGKGAGRSEEPADTAAALAGLAAALGDVSRRHPELASALGMALRSLELWARAMTESRHGHHRADESAAQAAPERKAR